MVAVVRSGLRVLVGPLVAAGRPEPREPLEHAAAIPATQASTSNIDRHPILTTRESHDGDLGARAKDSCGCA